MKRVFLLLLLLSLSADAESKATPLSHVSKEQGRIFLKGFMGDWRPATDQHKGVPPPPVQQPIPTNAVRIALPGPETLSLGQGAFQTIINQRRSIRAYADTALTLEELSFLLWCTQGVERVERDSEGRIINQFRTVPSGGARHPFETYLLVNRVEGLDSGVYRFLPFEHALVLIRKDPDLATKTYDSCYRQAATARAAVVFVWTAVPYRTEWRYGPLSYRMIAMEAGHVCQNLYLAAESIGAGACAMLGYNQVKMDNLIGVDGEEEFTIYLATVGKKAPDE